MSKRPEWAGRPIADRKHVIDLDRAAAMNEFHHKMPREQAEDEAYRSYQRDQHIHGAAHHLAGQKAARAAGQMHEARKHGVMYAEHLKKLGHEPHGPVPNEIAARHQKMVEEGAGTYKFRHHEGDSFLMEGDKPDGPRKD